MKSFNKCLLLASLLTFSLTSSTYASDIGLTVEGSTNKGSDLNLPKTAIGSKYNKTINVTYNDKLTAKPSISFNPASLPTNSGLTVKATNESLEGFTISITGTPKTKGNISFKAIVTPDKKVDNYGTSTTDNIIIEIIDSFPWAGNPTASTNKANNKGEISAKAGDVIGISFDVNSVTSVTIDEKTQTQLSALGLTWNEGNGNDQEYDEGYEGSGTIKTYASSNDLPSLSGKLIQTTPSKGVSFKVTATNANTKKSNAYTFTLKIGGDKPSFDVSTLTALQKGFNLDDDEKLVGAEIKLANDKDYYGPFTWSAKNLPAGLKLQPSDDGKSATLTGSLTKEGSFKPIITVENKNIGEKVEYTFPNPINVQKTPEIANATLKSAPAGKAYSATLKLTAGVGAKIYSYEVSPDKSNIKVTQTEAERTKGTVTIKTIGTTTLEYPSENEGIYEISFRLSNDVAITESIDTELVVTAQAPSITTKSLKAIAANTAPKDINLEIKSTGTTPIKWSANISDKSKQTLTKAGLEWFVEALDDQGLDLFGLTLSGDKAKGSTEIETKNNSVFLVASVDSSATSLPYAFTDLEMVLTAENAATDTSGKPATATIKISANGKAPSFANKKDYTLKILAESELNEDITKSISNDLILKEGTGPLAVTITGQGNTIEVTPVEPNKVDDAFKPDNKTSIMGDKGLFTLEGDAPTKKTTIKVTVSNPLVKGASATKNIIIDAQQGIEISDPDIKAGTLGGKLSGALKATGSKTIVFGLYAINDKIAELHSDDEDAEYSELDIEKYIPAKELKKLFDIQVDKAGKITANAIKNYPSDEVDALSAYDDVIDDGELTIAVYASNDVDFQVVEVPLTIETPTPKIASIAKIEATIGKSFKEKKVTATGATMLPMTWGIEAQPDGIKIDQKDTDVEKSKYGIAYIQADDDTPLKATVDEDGKFGSVKATVTVTDTAGNDAEATVDITIHDKQGKFAKSSVTLGGSIASNDDSGQIVPLYLKEGTGAYKWTAKSNTKGLDVKVMSEDAVATNEPIIVEIKTEGISGTEKKAQKAKFTLTGVYAYGDKAIKNITLNVTVTIAKDGEATSTTLETPEGFDGDAFKDSELIADTALPPLDKSVAKAKELSKSEELLKSEESKESKESKESEELESNEESELTEQTIKLGSERSAGSLTQSEKEALKGYIIAAVLPEIEVSESDWYELEVDLDENIPENAELVWFAFPRNAQSSDDDEAIFSDLSGEEITQVPAEHVISVNAWYNKGVIYAPVIAVPEQDAQE